MATFLSTDQYRRFRGNEDLATIESTFHSGLSQPAAPSDPALATPTSPVVSAGPAPLDPVTAPLVAPTPPAQPAQSGPIDLDALGQQFHAGLNSVTTSLFGGQPEPSAPAAPAPSVSAPAPTSNWETLARQQLGKPYQWGSAGGRSDFTDAATGFDCSGFVSYVYKNALGINLPAQTESAYAATKPISVREAKPGDIVQYNMDNPDPHVQHIAIYLGDGKVIQAGGGVDKNVNIAPIGQAGTYEFRRADGADTSAQNTAATRHVATTTAGLSGGGDLSGQVGAAGQNILNAAGNAASWLGEQGQKALQAVLITEGGLNKARGDQGQSAGPLQFYEGGQLANFARSKNLSLDAAKTYVEEHANEAVQWAIGTPDKPGYLGAAILAGQQQGLKDGDLATYAQQHGQVSVSPERAGQNWQALFGAGQTVASSGPQNPLDQLGADFRSSLDIVGAAKDQSLSSLADQFHAGLNTVGSALPDLGARLQSPDFATSPIAQQAAGQRPPPGKVVDQMASGLADVLMPGEGPIPVVKGVLETALNPKNLVGGADTAPLQFLGEAAAPLVARGASAIGKAVGPEVRSFLADESGELRLPGVAGEPAAAAATDTAEHGLTINLPKYVPEEVRGVIQAAYDATPHTMDAARRGVMTDAAVAELAAQTNRSAAQISALWKPGQAKNAETILALREGLNTASQGVLQAQQVIAANPKSTDALATFAAALSKHAAIQEVVTGVTAEAGRALRQFRQPVSGAQFGLQQLQRLAKGAKLTPDELAPYIAGLDLADPTRVAELARTLTTHSFADKWSAVWYFSLLSNPVTHIKNVVGNVLATVTSPLETAAAVPFDIARATVTRTPRQRYLGEVSSQFVGMAAGIQDGVTSGWQILRRGLSEAELTAKPEMAGGEAFKGQVSQALARGNLGGAAQGVAANVVLTPGRALRASDVVFRSINQTAAIYGEAYRIAKQEGLKGKALVDRVAAIRESPSSIPGLLERAEKSAAYRVFQQDGTFVQTMGRVRNALPVSKVVVPFVQTPYNIAKFALERTPLGLAGIVKDAAQGTLKGKGGGDLADRLARITLGSATGYAFYQYAAGGNLTGAAPRDETTRDEWQRQGKQAYSMKGPDGTWYSYQSIQPFSTILAASAALHEAQVAGHDDDFATGSTLLGLTLARATLDQPWTSGLSDFLDFMSGANVNNPSDLLSSSGSYAEKTVPAMIVPSLVRWLEAVGDDTIRDPQNVVQAVQARVPGLSAGVPARLNAWGHDIKRSELQRGLGGSLNIARPSVPTTDPVEVELNRLQLKGYRVEPGFVGRNISVLKQPVKLNEAQERKYQEDSGTIAYALLAAIVDTDEWRGLSDANKALTISRITDTTREMARTRMAPELVPAAVNSFIKQSEKRAAP